MPTSSEIWPDVINRASTSFPLESVPSGWPLPGGSVWLSKFTTVVSPW
jgi:hypothetical protein